MTRKRRGPRNLSFDLLNGDPRDVYEEDLSVLIPEGVEPRLMNEVVAMCNEAAKMGAAFPERADAFHRMWYWKALLTLARELDVRSSRPDTDAD